MITNQHNDGCCFKLTVIYENGNREYVMYGDDEDELWGHLVEVRHVLAPVQKIVIEDDSK